MVITAQPTVINTFGNHSATTPSPALLDSPPVESFPGGLKGRPLQEHAHHQLLALWSKTKGLVSCWDSTAEEGSQQAMNLVTQLDEDVGGSVTQVLGCAHNPVGYAGHQAHKCMLLICDILHIGLWTVREPYSGRMQMPVFSPTQTQ